MWPRFGSSPLPRAKAPTRSSGPWSFPCLGEFCPVDRPAAAEFGGFGEAGHKVALIPSDRCGPRREASPDRRWGANYVGGGDCKSLLFGHLRFDPRASTASNASPTTIDPLQSGDRLRGPCGHQTADSYLFDVGGAAYGVMCAEVRYRPLRQCPVVAWLEMSRSGVDCHGIGVVRHRGTPPSNACADRRIVILCSVLTGLVLIVVGLAPNRVVPTKPHRRCGNPPGRRLRRASSEREPDANVAYQRGSSAAVQLIVDATRHGQCACCVGPVEIGPGITSTAGDPSPRPAGWRIAAHPGHS